MRVIVTGAGGFIGSHVVRASLEQGHQVLAAVRKEGSRLRLAALADRIETVELCLEDRDEVARTVEHFEPDAIVHAAWYARPADYLHSSENLSSLATTLRLFDTLYWLGPHRVVGVGTCLEYSPGATACAESAPTDPRTLYASCKLGAWLVGRARARQSEGRLTWARLFHVYGPGESPERLIPAAARALRQGRAFLASPGMQVRDPIHVADVATALLCLAERGDSGVYNVCVGRPFTLRETLETVAALEGIEGHLVFGARPYADGEVMSVVGDPTKLRALGWQPRFPELRAGLKDTLRAAREVA
jgi:nucleoside-diphosphate-sugar epimerase